METSASIYELRITPGIGFITGPQGQRAQQDALRLDSAQARRVVVSLVGRERQGKTSLRRLLSGEPFDSHEPSTVGLERDLVDTQALDAGSSEWSEWRPLELQAANQSEFTDMLGRHIRQRLERQRHRIPLSRRVMNSVLTLTKIAAITYLSLLLFFWASSSATPGQWPVFGLTAVGTCLASGLVFGARDGFGIAVGIYHFIVLCESLVRWRTDAWYADVVAEDGVVRTVASGVLWYGAMEAVVAVVFGMSLGLGMECVFCVSQQPRTDYFLHGHPFLLPQLHVLVVSSLLGLGCAQYRFSRFVIVPLAGVALATLPPFLGYVFLCGMATGVSHGLFLGCGQSLLFPRLNHLIKDVTTSMYGRHLARHLLGLLPGFLVTRLFGWSLVTAPFNLLLVHLETVVALVAVNELFVPSGKPTGTKRSTRAVKDEDLVCYRRPKQKQSESSIGIEQPSCVLGSEWMKPTPRIVVRDFAGHPLYYSAHHVYMAGQCVYVLVFSLVEAKNDFDNVLRNVIGWLQSIYLHTGFPDTRVFIVGTHRDDPELARCGMDVVAAIGRRLRKELPRHFHNMLVWTDNDTPLFPVENSLRDKHDQDHRYFRSRLLQTVNELNAEKHPLRYFYFFHILEERRARSQLIEQSDALMAQCQANQCAIKDRDDFDAMLLLFHRLGEVLYFPDNNLLQSVVVLSPHAVLDLLCKLLDVPRMADRAHGLVTDWSRLQTTGVCSRALFDHVLHKHAKELKPHSDTILYLLQTLNLICPLSTRRAETDIARHMDGEGERFAIRAPCEHDERQEECYLVPAALPDKLTYPHHYWETTSADWELLIDGLPVLPHPAFLRLLSVCAAHDACDAQDELGSPVLTACKSQAAFTFERSQCYKLELVSSKVTYSYHGRLLKLTIAGNRHHAVDGIPLARDQNVPGMNTANSRGSVAPHALVDFVWKSLVEIVRRDFRRCHLRIGVSCPCMAPHQNVQQAEDGFHFLSLCDTRDRTTRNFAVSQEKEFWCCGRRVLYRKGKACELSSQGGWKTAVRPKLPVLEVPLSDIPQALHAQICDLLDVPHALGNDWTALAGQLGMTVRQVELLRHRAPRDPCDSLLQDWACRTPSATLRDLASVMLRIQRLDVVKTIEDFALKV